MVRKECKEGARSSWTLWGPHCLGQEGARRSGCVTPAWLILETAGQTCRSFPEERERGCRVCVLGSGPGESSDGQLARTQVVSGLLGRGRPRDRTSGTATRQGRSVLTAAPPGPTAPLLPPASLEASSQCMARLAPSACPGKGPALLLMFQGPKMRPFALALKYFLAFSAALLPGGRTSLSIVLSIDDLSRLL